MGTEGRGIGYEFQRLGRRQVEGNFEGGKITSDAGGLLLSEVESRFEILKQFAACFTDHRNPILTEHALEELLAQRVYGLASVAIENPRFAQSPSRRVNLALVIRGSKLVAQAIESLADMYR